MPALLCIAIFFESGCGRFRVKGARRVLEATKADRSVDAIFMFVLNGGGESLLSARTLDIDLKSMRQS